jgi:hypothetical protein
VSALKNVVNSLFQYSCVPVANQSGKAVTPGSIFVSHIMILELLVVPLTRPYNTLVDRAVGSLQESVCFDTIVERRVVVIGNGRVNHNDVGLLSRVQGRHQLSHLFQRESFWVCCEDMSGVHVVDIGP